jgi:hypothetical protein
LRASAEVHPQRHRYAWLWLLPRHFCPRTRLRFPEDITTVRSACEQPATDHKIDYRVGGYRPKPVPARELPGYQDFVTPLTDPNIAVDARGVAVSIYDGHRVYHPLRHRPLRDHASAESYRITHDRAYLDRVKVNAGFLLNHAVSRYGARYFPCRFNYLLFGRTSDRCKRPGSLRSRKGQHSRYSFVCIP